MPFVTVDLDDLHEIVLEKCESFTNMVVWPAGEKLNPERWLTNFLPDEREHSLYLLNAFTYYNLDIAISLLKSSIVNLSNKLLPATSYTDILNRWNGFLNSTAFVPVTGEVPNITDSGNLLAGYLRRDLNINESDIFTMEHFFDPINRAIASTYKSIVFFDDFVGSGQQFNTMWNHGQVSGVKIKTICNSLSLVPHYCGMVATEYGYKNIIRESPEVDLNFSHILRPNVSPLHPNSLAWPAHLKESGPEFVLKATRRAGISERNLKGFHDLGLAIAFSFTIPDATLPIYRTSNNNWKPLMERT